MTEAWRFFRGDVEPAATRIAGRRRLRAIGLLPLLLGCAAAFAQQMQIIDLHYRNADQVIPVLQPLLEPGDALTGMDDKLFLRAGPATLARVVEAIEIVDRPPRQLVITVGQGTVADIANESVHGAATISGGDLSAGINRPPGSDTSAQIIASGHSQQAAMRSVSKVQAIDGTEAYIAVGRQVPFSSTQVTPGWGGPVVTQSTTFRDVDTGFYATARVNGDLVTISISPRQQSYDRARGGTIRTAGTDSTVTARLGEWIELGAASDSGSSSDGGLLTWGRHTSQSQYSVWLKVEEAP